MKIITLCGSLKFKEEMMIIAERLSLDGNCVFTPVFPILDNSERTSEQLKKLKDEHFKKIELSDSILVVNVNNYIGESTNLEIEYSKKLGKEIIYYTDLMKNHKLEKYGIYTKHNIMENGEKRFRLIGNDGSSYIRTESSSNGGWQKSHYHTLIKELYLVQKGEIIFAQLINNKINIKKYIKNEFFISKPMIPHNIYMFPDSILHTIKYGDCLKSDWIPSQELDEMIKIDGNILLYYFNEKKDKQKN